MWRDSVHHHQEPGPVVFPGNREKTPHPADHQTVVGVDLLLLLYSHPDSRQDQEQAKQNHDPLKTHQRRACGDKHPAEYHCAQHTVEQYLMLIPQRHREIAEYQGEHEHIVDGERFLHHVTRQKFQN